MIRVLFIMTDLGGGGAELSLLELLGRLDRRRIEPSLFLLQRSGVHLNRIQNIKVCYGCEAGARIRNHMPYILLKAIVLGMRADVIVGSMEGKPTYVAWMAAKLLRKPVIGWIRTELSEYYRNFPGWASRMARWMYPRCTGVVVPSQGAADSISRMAQVSPARLHTIYNPVDPERARAQSIEARPAGMRELGQAHYMIGIGRLKNEQKGFDLLLRAHAAVRKRGIDHRLVILGDGDDRISLEQLARELNVQDSLIMPGFEPNPFPWLKDARALVAPARVDGFGRIFLEAMALGVPVIGSPASGPAEILDGGKYGISVGHEDVEALANAMELLLVDDEMHARYAALSLKRSQEYSPAKPVQQWEELLRAISPE